LEGSHSQATHSHAGHVSHKGLIVNVFVAGASADSSTANNTRTMIMPPLTEASALSAMAFPYQQLVAAAALEEE
jgi:hypothetical protein